MYWKPLDELEREVMGSVNLDYFWEIIIHNVLKAG